MFLENPLKLRKKFAKNLPKRWRFNRKAVLKALPKIALGFLAFILIVVAWYSKDLPTPNKIKNRAQLASTQIFDRNGQLIFAFSGEKKRLPITLQEVPDFAEQATIAVEDKNFYRHIGIQPKSVARAFLNNILPAKRSTQGGSTITQQYVKNALLTQKRTLSRKIKEVILSLELEAIYSKDQILEFYLNEIPYGTNAYGIEAASRTYFGKPAKDLTLAEAAALVALPQAPTYYSPYGSHKDELLRRKNFVLDQIVKENYIAKSQADEAKKQEIKFAARRDAITAPHFVFYVKEYLVDQYGEKMVDEGGLKVTTTLDLETQKQAEQAVEEGSKNLDKRGANNAALAAVDTKTGQILAMVGSVDYFNEEIDGQVNVTTAKRQPGSSFKPLVYATAFKGKYNPAFTLYDFSTDFGGGYRPDNYTGQNYGPVTMRQALANSLNIPAVKTLGLVGVKNAIATAQDLGVTTLTQPDRYGLALVLGGGEVRPLEMAGAFAAFGNEGKYNPTAAILKVENNKGQVLEEFKQPKNAQRIDAQIAYEITHILSDNDARQMVFGFTGAFNVPGQKTFVKTGTTQEFRDGWAIGGSRYITAAVWAGNTNNKPMKKGADGSVVALPIWNKFMTVYHKTKQAEDFPIPTGIQTVTVDKLSNKLPTEVSPELVSDIFASWQVPADKDDVHVKVKVNKLTGKLATEFTPADLVEERLFTAIRSEMPGNPNWEGPVQAWAAENGLTNAPPKDKDDQYDNANKKPVIVITKPSADEKINGDLVIETSASAFYGIKEVQFYFNKVQIGSVAAAPYSYRYAAANLASGIHLAKTVVVDTNGGTASTEVQFIVPPLPPTISNVTAIGVSTNSVTINWTTSKSAASQVEYGLTTGYGSTSVADNNLLVSHSVSLGGLVPKTTYHFRVISKDVGGLTATSSDFTFATQ